MSRNKRKNTEKIILIHLSEENNDEKIAYDTCVEKIPYPVPVIVSRQKEQTELIEV